MSDRPAFIDNRDGNALVRAVREVLAAAEPDLLFPQWPSQESN